MPLSFYMDAHIPAPITKGLRRRGVDMLTAQEDDADEFPDPDLLERATALHRVLFTFDDDFLAEAARRQAARIAFAGILFAQPTRISIGACVRDLEALAREKAPDELRNRVVYLPL